MRVLGVGVDLVQNVRMSMLLKKPYSNRFLEKVLHKEEIKEFLGLTNDQGKVQYLASRWAVKEAVVKATGRRNLEFHEMRILKDEHGKPSLELCSEINKGIANEINLQTHENDYSIGYAMATQRIV